MPLSTARMDPWKAGRLLYRTGLVALFLSVAFYFGPNRMLFHKWTSLDASDFVPVVVAKCVPTVRVMKAYAREHAGHLPGSNEDLGPAFKDRPNVGMVSSNGFEFLDFDHAMQSIQYDFGPRGERWIVRGVFLNDTIPVPAVAEPPMSQP